MTTTKETAKTLVQRIAQVMIDLEPVEKTGRVAFGNTKYNYVKSETLFALLQKKLAKAGIVVIPRVEGFEYSPDGKVLNVRTGYRIENVDDPNDFRDVPWMGQAKCDDDKAANKAGTSSEKYFLMKLLLISDEEDPDGEVYVDNDPDADMRREVASLMKADHDAAANLPKSAREMTHEELEKALPWLRRRAQQRA